MCSCFPLFLLNIFAHFEQVLAEYSFQFKHVGPYLSKQFYFSLFSVFVHSRVSYATDKVLAQTGSKIEKGETVAPLQKAGNGALFVDDDLWRGNGKVSVEVIKPMI